MGIMQHIFHLPAHIIAKARWKEGGQMEEEKRREEDIDDMIFSGEEWHESER